MIEAVAFVLAAGIGSRVGAAIPKQFLHVAGVPILRRTLGTYARVRRIVVVYHPIHLDLTRQIVAPIRSHIEFAEGGLTRRESIAAALEHVGSLPNDMPVILQNAASPNTPVELVERCLEALQEFRICSHVDRSPGLCTYR